MFWGLGQVKEVNPNEICGGRGVASVEAGQNFWHGVASMLTWGIYEPREYRIYCNSGGRGNYGTYMRRSNNYNSYSY